MMPRFVVLAALLVAGSALPGCGEKPQTLGAPQTDAAAYTGTGAQAFTAGSWKQGDKASWEQQMRSRTANGQNEYAKTAR